MRLLLCVLVLLTSLSAFAGSVFLNGTSIDGVTNQKFEKANVRIDDKGNVFIDAPGYSVRTVEPGVAPPAAPAATLTKKYFLVTEQHTTGLAEFDIDVYVNSKWLRKLKGSEEQIVADITKHLNPGKNAVLLVAHKTATGDQRRSTNVAHFFKVIIGEGSEADGKLTIDNPLVRFQRTAADTEDLSKEFAVTTH